MLKLQLKRNENPFENKEEAINGLKDQLAAANAGEIVIATYKQEDPYMHSIPLYDTDGGTTYVDWFNENVWLFDKALTVGDQFEFEFDGVVPLDEGIYSYANASNRCIWGISENSGFYGIMLPLWRYSAIDLTEPISDLGTCTVLCTIIYNDTSGNLEADVQIQGGENTGSHHVNGTGGKGFGFLNASSNTVVVNKLKFTYIPVTPILKSDLYPDTEHYSEIQYPEEN